MENKYLGVDLSEHNNNIDFGKLKKNGVDFVILRAGFGVVSAQKDKNFETYYQLCKLHNLKVGCYWYMYADSQLDIDLEIQAFKDVIKGKQFEYPVFLDIEEQRTFNIPDLEKHVNDGLLSLEKDGYFCGVYCSDYHFSKMLPNVKNRFVQWVANWNGEPLSALNGKRGIHQFIVKQDATFHKDNLDYNMSNYDYSQIIKDGYNGYPKSVLEEPVKNDMKCEYEDIRINLINIQDKLKGICKEIEEML